MKKHENMPEGVGTKQPKAKSALLQTYFMSLLCVVLCVGMFFTTTFAWFTNEVNSTGNEIYIGILDVDLLKQTDSGLKDLADNNNKLFNDTIRWEPGYTAVETVHVVNKGDLAFRYTMTFTDGMLNGETNAKLLEVAKWFDVWVYHNEKNEIPTVTEYDQITAENSGWVNAGTLDVILEGAPVFNDVMTEVREEGQKAEDINAGTKDGKATKATYTIAIHMKEDAEITAMGQRISLSVKLIAYQAGNEKDAFGDKYDRMVATVEELREAFREGGTYVLAADITAKDVETLAVVPEGKEVELYLNGHNINVKLADPNGRSTELFYLYKDAKLTIHADKNSKIHMVAGKSDKLVSAMFNNCGGTVVINGGAYTMDYGTYGEGYLLPTFVDNNSTTDAALLIINDGTFTHSRNMFRNFANHNEKVAKIVINGGTFLGAQNDPGAIWNQKPSDKTPDGAGIVQINGGVFKYMTVCTGFVDANKNPLGVTASGNITLSKEWTPDGAELIAEIFSPADAG